MKPLSIVVVDDDCICLKLVQRLLRQTEHRVELYETQSAASERLAVSAADLVFVDFRMPGQSGVDFLERFSGELAGSCVCLWSSGRLPVESQQKAERLGARVLSKSLLRDRDGFIAFCERGTYTEKLAG